tara:strand:+ start:916 stop:1275 length:360 start_codon:yes stop_codon:yes gene_type:complete
LQGTTVKICAGYALISGFAYDMESKDVVEVDRSWSDRVVNNLMRVRMCTADNLILQITFIHDNQARMAFMAEKSPLLSAESAADDHFPQDKQMADVVNMWSTDHILANVDVEGLVLQGM